MADVDVIVVGGGPAGWAAAAALAGAGLDTTLVAPHSDVPWPGVYGAWVDDVAGLGLGEIWQATWPSPVVIGNERRELDRAFGLIDNAALGTALRTLLTAGGGRAVAGWVVGSNHDRWRSTVVLSDGRILSGRVIVDASGAGAALLQRPARPRPAFQQSQGVVAPDGGVERCVLIDLSGGRPDDRDATYGMAIGRGDGSALFAETSLVRRPELPAGLVAHRLDGRLAALGVDDRDLRARASACEPVVLARPSAAQREVGFGAAAGAVHPFATLGTTLGAATRLGRAAADALVGRRATPVSASRAGWDAVWPPRRRRARDLDRHVVEALARFDRAGQRRFVDRLFALDRDTWAAYVSGTLSPRELGAVIGELLGHRSARAARR